VWMILRKSWPVRGLKMKMAPLMGLVVCFMVRGNGYKERGVRLCRATAGATGWTSCIGKRLLHQKHPPRLTRFPSNVLWMVTRYTLVSSTNLQGVRTVK